MVWNGGGQRRAAEEAARAFGKEISKRLSASSPILTSAGTHLDNPHNILGFITYIAIILQGFVGVTQFFVPKLYGSVDKAKAIYKYHRLSGYVIFILSLATVAASTQTYFAKNILHLKLWAVLLASVIAVAGIVPRIRLSKFGWLAGRG